jgi:hypothetical protein
MTSAELHAERSALAVAVLRSSGRLRLRVRGASMLPTLWPNDVVEIASCSVEDVGPGEIILALREGRFFLHRWVSRSGASGFLLQGDSMPAPDPLFLNEALLGRLASRVRRTAGQRPVRESRATETRQIETLPILPLRWWSWAIGRVICYCGPVRRLALKLHSLRERPQHNTQDANSVSIGQTAA